MQIKLREAKNMLEIKNKGKMKKEMMKGEHLFSYDKYEAHEKVIRAKVLYRALIRYPQFNQMPCKIKGCIHKKRNGRCGLEKCQLELDDNDDLTGICLCFKKEEKT